MRVVGVDPASAKPLAFALVAIGVCIEKPSLLFAEEGTVEDLYAFLQKTSPQCVAVEDQYMGLNYKTSKSLSWAAGKAMGAAEILGIPVRVVNVASWKAKYLHKAEKGYKLSPQEACRERFRAEVDTDDKACAALIAYFEAVKLRTAV